MTLQPLLVLDVSDVQGENMREISIPHGSIRHIINSPLQCFRHMTQDDEKVNVGIGLRVASGMGTIQDQGYQFFSQFLSQFPCESV